MRRHRHGPPFPFDRHDYHDPAWWAAHHHARHHHWHRRGRGLRTRIFRFFGVAIFATLLLSAGVFHAFSGDARRGGMAGERARIDHYVANTLGTAWSDPLARHESLLAIDRDLELPARLRDASGTVIDQVAWPRACHVVESMPVVGRDGAREGTVEACVDAVVQWRRPWQLPLVIVLAGVMLWAMAGAVARRLTRPLGELTHVARRLGEGDLSARVNLCGRPADGEVGTLSVAINEMAERIERQLRDQRQLLGAVSHELRTPLTRIRLLIELARDGVRSRDRDPLDEIDREVVEIDALVADLLASSRVDFAAIAPRELETRATAVRAIERSGIEGVRLEADGEPGSVIADATLLARALGNLLENARKYGGPNVSMRVRDLGDGVGFEVDDDGRGFAPGDEDRVFEPFYRGADRASDDAAAQGGTGLGLALVKRIAEAHGGRVWARNLDGGGARVAIELPRLPPSRDAHD